MVATPLESINWVVVRMIGDLLKPLQFLPSLNLEPVRKLPVPRKKNEAYQRWRKALARFTMTPYQNPGWVCAEDWEGGGDGAQRQQS